MTDSPARSTSKSHRRRFEPTLTRESARINDNQITPEDHHRGDMPPPPVPLVAVGRVPQAPGKISSNAQRLRLAPSPSVTIMMESPSDRSASPNDRGSRGSDKVRQFDRAYGRYPSANTESVPSTPSRRAGSASLKKPEITLYTNEERKKRKRMERGIISPSPRKTMLQPLSDVDSTSKSLSRRPRFSATNADIGMMETSSHSRMTPPLFRDEDYEVRSDNDAQEMPRETRRMQDELANSNRVDDVTPYMSEDGEPFESSTGENWLDGQDDVNFRDESEVDKETLDKYPDLSAGLKLAAPLSRAHLSYSEMTFDERTKSCQLLIDRFTKAAQDGQEILKQKIGRMDTYMEQIEAHHLQLNIRQQQLEARQEQIRVGVQAVISGPTPK